ncbi:MAG: GMC family oxidoreductase [Solirubrobacteraceae bacterium]|nr:GMC family oxidoreductase [Solirubrobacteraceae bacterium]
MSTAEHHDVVVVGSGFGGSVTACRLAEAGMDVCVLERGKAIAPGEFPRTAHQLRNAFWDPSEGLHGMYDVWSFKELGAVVASGLGGGSLIYANVLLRKDPEWFTEQRDGVPWSWPISYADLAPHYDRIEADLQPTPFPDAYLDRSPKATAFAQAAAGAGLETFRPPLAVAFSENGGAPRPGRALPDDDNLHDAARRTCTLCGECDLGCNDGAKRTMDLTYLSRAKRAGATIRPRTEVRLIAPRPEGGYVVRAVTHPEEREGTPTNTHDPALCPPVTLTCDRLVLAAGTLGTTYLLLRNRARLPHLSPTLGTRFNGNGDHIAFVRRAGEETSGKARRLREIEGSRGPVITTAARVGDDASGMAGYYLQDAGYPAHTAWMLQLTGMPRALWQAKRTLLRVARERMTGRVDPHLGADIATLFGDLRTPAGMLPILGMGREVTHARLYLDGDTLLTDWSRKHAGRVFGRVRAASRAIADQLGGRFAADPVGRRRAPTVTVHALGGAPMGRDAREGVVDEYGQVFGHPGLSVACGAAMPGSVGPNPSLTIAAFADRHAEHILRQEGRL